MHNKFDKKVNCFDNRLELHSNLIVGVCQQFFFKNTMDEIVAKVCEVLIVEQEQIIQSLPKYFEEPSLTFIRGYNNYEVVLSCLSLTVKQRKYLTKKLPTKG